MWWASLLGGIIQVSGTIVGKVLISLGIGYVSYSGIDTAFSFARSEFLTGLSGLPADAVAMAGALKIGVCISMLLSALTVRATLGGLTSGTLKRMVTR